MKDKLLSIGVFGSIVFLSLVVMGANIVGNINVEENSSEQGSILSPISGMQIISVDLYPGETIDNYFVDVTNTLSETTTLRSNISGKVNEFIDIENPIIELEPGESSKVNLTINVPVDAISGVYSGTLSLKLDGKSKNIPANLRVLPPSDPLINLDIDTLADTIPPGKKLPVQATVINPHNLERSTTLKIQLLDPLSKDVLNETETYPFVDKTVTITENLNIPDNLAKSSIGGEKYLVRGVLSYDESENRAREVEDMSEITVKANLLDTNLFGIPLWVFPILIVMIAIVAYGYYLYKKQKSEKKRYLAGIDFTSIPKAGRRSAFIGRISESGIRSFMDIDRLTEHSLVAGSTGGGKTVAAQDIVEEALTNDVAVLVFDPTAQWTGFLRPNKEKGMFNLYSRFGMKKKDARGFDGNIKIMKPPIREFKVKKYMNPGEITIFCLNNLDSEQIEELFIEVILSVFRARMEESTKLDTLIVFDEVHRMLPKFGGTGKGLTQLERGVREFRKWGIGLILISQVLADYPKDVEANVATEVQMRTRYEGDLDRIKMKYGEDVMRSVVKAQVGTGMFQNSQYNHGRPYFVTFRPLLHNPRRLSDKELDTYEKYDNRIESLRSRLERAKKAGVDVFDLELELDLALSNLKKGSFDIVDMYLESLESRVDRMEKEQKGTIEERGERGELQTATTDGGSGEEPSRESTSEPSGGGGLSGSDFDNDLKSLQDEITGKDK